MGSNYPFLTSKERDNETGLDYFLARYYSSGQGRFEVSIEHMKTHSLLNLLDETLTDSQVNEDLLQVLQNGRINGLAVIEIEGTRVPVPLNVGLLVVTKAVFKDRYNSDFGTLRAQVAIGDVRGHEVGDVVAKYCLQRCIMMKTAT